jgi:hypothetical protein
MNKSIEMLALRRQLLQARSTLCRVRIRAELSALRDPLRWAQAGVAAVASHPVRYTLIGLALNGVAHGRLQQWLMPAARTLLLTQLASVAFNLLRRPAPRPQSPAGELSVGQRPGRAPVNRP